MAYISNFYNDSNNRSVIRKRFVNAWNSGNLDLTNIKFHLTKYLEEVAVWGAENILYMSKYRENGKTVYKYYNNETGEFFTDVEDPNIPEYFYKDYSLEDAFDNNVLYMDNALEAVRSEKASEIDHFTYDPVENINDLSNIGLKISVNKGRKFKGEGILIGIIQKNAYWPGGGASYYNAKIYDPATGNIDYANLSYVTFIGFDNIIESYKTWYKENLKNLTEDDIKVRSDYYNGYVFDINDNNMSLIDYLKNNIMKSEDIKKGQEVINNINEEKARKNAAFKEEKMKQLIDWVKNNTDKKGDAIERLAEHIYTKRYGYRD